MENSHEFHEIAEKYIMQNELGMQILEDSITELGYDESRPVTLYEGKILDGRARYLVCKKLGVEPSIDVFEGSEEEASAVVRVLNGYGKEKKFGF